MPRSSNNYIRNEIVRITRILEDKYGIEITEVKEIDYAIQYKVNLLRGNNEFALNVYYKKKKDKFTFTSQGNNVDKEVMNIIEDTFFRRDNIEDIKEHDNHSNEKNSNIREYKKILKRYNELKEYRNDKFDFIDFLQDIKKVIGEENVNDRWRYDFNKIEELIVNYIGE